jgi:exodeoxyribonuclease VII small subunit
VTDKAAEPQNFEQTIEELEKIVHSLEQGEVPLQTALEQFERGVNLAKQGQATLAAAEQKVQILMAENGQSELQDFDNNDE